MEATMDLISKTQAQSILADQNKLKVICDQLTDRVEELLKSLDIDYIVNSKHISCACPIHGGDNMSALNIYYIGEEYRGNWKCRTHQCEKIFMGSIIGFVRGVLSRKKFDWKRKGDRFVSFQDTINFVAEFLSIDNIDNIQANLNTNNSFIKRSTILQSSVTKSKGVPREKIKQLLSVPSQYFIKRGFNKDILSKYDIGDCETEGKEMSGRAVVPIYDLDYKYMIGCSGRVMDDNIKPKWKHSKGFKAEEHLYNIWFAQKYIQKTNEVIIVESPGNVWKLEENGIHNSVATFGAHLTDKQKMMLDISGAMKIIVIMDSDNAGDIARKQIDEKCFKTYNIEHIRLSKNDVAELSVEEINSQIKSRITL